MGNVSLKITPLLVKATVFHDKNYILTLLVFVHLFKTKILSQIFTLLQKDFHLEWKNKSAALGLLLFAFSATYTAYHIFGENIDGSVWISIFWLISIFGSIHATAHSFTKESSEEFLFYYSLVKPQTILIEKLIYNNLWIATLALINIALFSLFFGNPVESLGVFIAGGVIGSMSITTVLTVVSAIAAKLKNNFTLMTIMSLPLLIPAILIGLSISMQALEPISIYEVWRFILSGCLFILLCSVISYVLIPYLWQD